MNEYFEKIITLFLSLGEKFGYGAIFIGAIADCLVPIVPSEIIFGAAGFWAYKGYIYLPFAILSAVLGSIVANSIFWYLGKEYGTAFLAKWGKYLGFSNDDLEKSKKVFAKWGYWSVFVCQFIPLFRSLISIPSGILDLKYKRFVVATTAGSIVWSSTLMTIAYNLGEKWGEIEGILTTFGKPILFIAIAIFILILGKILYNKFNSKKLN